MRVFIDWRDDWLLHISEVDEEHRELVGLLNDIADRWDCCRNADGGASRRGAPEDVLVLLEALGEHVRTHFSNEEQLMEELAYPDYDSHRYEHLTLVAEYADLLREIRREGLACLDGQTLSALKSWLIGHIVGADKKFGDYYRETVRGVSRHKRDDFRRMWMRMSLVE